MTSINTTLSTLLCSEQRRKKAYAEARSLADAILFTMGIPPQDHFLGPILDTGCEDNRAALTRWVLTHSDTMDGYSSPERIRLLTMRLRDLLEDVVC